MLVQANHIKRYADHKTRDIQHENGKEHTRTCISQTNITLWNVKHFGTQCCTHKRKLSIGMRVPRIAR